MRPLSRQGRRPFPIGLGATLAIAALAGCSDDGGAGGEQSPSAGGALGTGGTVSSAGMGGTMWTPSGGTGTPGVGGLTTGGAGDQASGGQASGGADEQSTGGQGPGGQSTGGQSTGGQSTGGQSTGGQSTGGQSTGGQSTGGQSTGGQATGGTGGSPPSDCTEGRCLEFVEAHNAVRTSINNGTDYDQPIASPPLELVGWDPLIAAKAQQWADSMDHWDDGHSSSAFRTYESTHHNGYHGENMAIGDGSAQQAVIELWVDSETQGCTLRDCGGHYTQVVWRESLWIGCGWKDNVPFVVRGQTYHGTLTVCQYGPGGNSGGDPY